MPKITGGKGIRMKLGCDSFAYFNIDYDNEGRKNNTLEVCVHPNGKYAVSVIGARGATKYSMANSFDGVLDKRNILEDLEGNNAFRNLLTDLGVNFYAYKSRVGAYKRNRRWGWA